MGGFVSVQVCEVGKRHARRVLWGLQEESREFGLSDHREHRERPPDVSFPIWVFGRIGSYKTPLSTQPRNTTRYSSRRTKHTFGSRRAVLFRSGSRLRIPVQGRNRETGRDFGVDDGRVAC